MSTPAVLDTIDHAIADHGLSADAMRWTPDPPPLATGGVVRGLPDIARLFDVPPCMVPVRPVDGFTIQPWQAEAMRRIGRQLEVAATRLGEQVTQAIKGARLSYAWLDEVQWDRCRRPARVSRMRRAYRAKRRGW